MYSAPSSNLYMIAIAGPSCAGKTELANALAVQLRCSILQLDSYYRDLSAIPARERAGKNFDDPAALDHELLIQQVHALHQGQSVERPVYDFATHTRFPQRERFCVHRFLILEGLYALYWPELRKLAATKVFVQVPDTICLNRRKRRDVIERGRNVDSVVKQFTKTVQPMASLYLQPTREYADLVLSGEQALSLSVGAVLDHVQRNRETEVAPEAAHGAAPGGYRDEKTCIKRARGAD
ncbi:MAG: uridine kinase [Acidobacteria bacterium]|nr:uridine kinase [Acidobacteriota bacterium]